MTNATSSTLRVVPLGGPLGADIGGVDLSQEIGAGTLAAILEAWAQHLVLRFRGQRLDEELDDPAVEDVRDDRRDEHRGQAEDDPRPQLVEVLDERRLLAVLKATRQTGHDD